VGSGQWAEGSGQWTVGCGRRQWTVGCVQWAITVGSDSGLLSLVWQDWVPLQNIHYISLQNIRLKQKFLSDPNSFFMKIY
jgi:hypothetical protein